MELSKDDLLVVLKAWELNLEKYQQFQNEYRKAGDHEGVQFAQGFINIATNGIENVKCSIAEMK